MFPEKATAINTSRDFWVYNFSESLLNKNVSNLIQNYNSELDLLNNQKDKFKLNVSPSYIKWSTGLKNSLYRNKKIEYNKFKCTTGLYRPFTKKKLYYDRDLIERPSSFDKIFSDDNLVIITSGKGSRKGFSALVTDLIPNYDTLEKAQAYPLYLNDNQSILKISDFNVDDNLIKEMKMDAESLFYYVYGVLNCPEYVDKYLNDLLKGRPNIPKLKNRNQFSKIGKELANLHVNYEKYYDETIVDIIYKENEAIEYKVKKMKLVRNKDSYAIKFNNVITINKIPKEAFDYQINGKSAIEWIIDQYQIKIDNKSGLIDDPNTYSSDEKYIFKLLLAVINISCKTVNLKSTFPQIEFE